MQDSRIAHAGTVEHDQDQQHHEKPSVLKKVKNKAKKIKNTLGSKIHGGHDEHGHEHEHEHGRYDEDDDDDDEELEQDPEVHGAPMYESAAASRYVEPQPRVNMGHLSPVEEYPHPHGSLDPLRKGNHPTNVTHPAPGAASMSDKPKVHFGHSSSPMEEDPTRNVSTGSYQTEVTYPPAPLTGHAAGSPMENDPHRTRNVTPGHFQTDVTYPPTGAAMLEQTRGNLGHVPPLEKDTYRSEQPKLNIGHLSPLEKHPHGHGLEQPRGNIGHLSPLEKGTHKSEQPRGNIGHLSQLEKDPNGPKDPLRTHSPGNYQSKVTDPTYGGGKEVDVNPIISSFGKMEVTSDEPEFRSRKPSPPTGSHDQFSPDYAPIPTNTMETSGNPQSASLPRSFDDESREAQHDTTNVGDEQHSANQGSSYTGKLSYATSAIAGTAISAKNVVASKIGLGGGNEGAHDTSRTSPKMGTGKVAGTHDTPTTTAPAKATGMVAGTAEYGKQLASSVYDKVAGAGSAVVSKIPGTGSTGAGSAAGIENEGTRTHDTPTAGTGIVGGTTEYGKKIASTVYDKVAGAGSAVVSKMPGTGSAGSAAGIENEGTRAHDTPTAGTGIVGGTTEYGKQIASTVYDKVAGAGSAVVSKVKGTSPGTGADAVTATTTTGAKMDTGSGPDKGVSVKMYFAEKFRPGEEDKALSEVITGALHKSDEDKQKEHAKKVEEALGKITESEEVTKRLGTDEGVHHGSDDGDGSGVVVGGGVGSGVGMVDRLKGTVASWFGGNTVGQTHPTSESPNSSNVGKQEHDFIAASHHEGDVTATSHGNAGSERRLQESGN